MFQFNTNARQIIDESLVLPKEMRKAVLAIGNFDGVHIGHQAILQQALNIAHKPNQTAKPYGVITFSPHPRAFFNPNKSFFRLTDNPSRAGLFKQLGIDLLVILEFSKQLSQLSAEDFVKKILVNILDVSHIIIGADFCFGKNRTGDAALLSQMGKKYGFGVTILKQVQNNGEVISSSQIRQALREGNVERACELLGHHWYVQGVVEKGQQLGRTIGFPTINIATRACCDLKEGSYAATVEIDGKFYQGAANFGSRPSVDGVGVRLETFIFDFDDDVYGKNVKTYLHKFIRKDETFDGLDILIAAIDKDVEMVKQYFAKNNPLPIKIANLN